MAESPALGGKFTFKVEDQTVTTRVDGKEVAEYVVTDVAEEVDRIAKQHPGKTVYAFDRDGKEVYQHQHNTFERR